MKEIGKFLRERREAKGISLIETEKDLKIRRKYLQAIEEGNIDIIPGRTYLVGYLRNYSRYLGIDEENINQIIRTYNNLEKNKINLEKNVYPKKKNKSMFKKKRFILSIKYVYLISFVLVIFIGLLLLNHSLKEAQNFPVPSPEIEKQTDINIEENTNNMNVLPEENVEIKTETVDKETPPLENILISKMPILKIIANDRAWIKILSKDKIIFEGILFEKEEISWESEDSLNIITEYPSKIDVYYNDEAIKSNKRIDNKYIVEYNFNSTENNI
jgi:cytoskeletal protein RodZ